MKLKRAFKIAKQKGLDVKIVLFKRDKRYVNTLNRFAKVFPEPFEKILDDEYERDFRKVFAKALLANETPYKVRGIFIRNGKNPSWYTKRKEY